jgi:uncharacterized membrane protein YebE (DUF533 family)
MAETSFTDLLGSLMQTAFPPATDRIKQGMGAGGPASGSDIGNLLQSLGLDTSKLGDVLGGAGKIGDILGGAGNLGDILKSGKLGDLLGGAGGKLGDILGGKGSLGDLLGGLFGGQGGEGIGQTISGTLEEAQRSIGNDKNIALAALGALAGAILGGGSKSMKGAVGGGVLALLGALAYAALKGTQQEQQEVPLTLRHPETPAEKAILEDQAQLVLRAMINASKADGQIDQGEVQRIIGKLAEDGADSAARDFVLAEMSKPMESEAIVAAAQGNPQLGAELYAASLLAIKVDTPAEQAYMQNLSTALGLPAQAVTNLQNSMGLVS